MNINTQDNQCNISSIPVKVKNRTFLSNYQTHCHNQHEIKYHCPYHSPQQNEKIMTTSKTSAQIYKYPEDNDINSSPEQLTYSINLNNENRRKNLKLNKLNYSYNTLYKSKSSVNAYNKSTPSNENNDVSSYINVPKKEYKQIFSYEKKNSNNNIYKNNKINNEFDSINNDDDINYQNSGRRKYINKWSKKKKSMNQQISKLNNEIKKTYSLIKSFENNDYITSEDTDKNSLNSKIDELYKENLEMKIDNAKKSKIINDYQNQKIITDMKILNQGVINEHLQNSNERRKNNLMVIQEENTNLLNKINELNDTNSIYLNKYKNLLDKYNDLLNQFKIIHEENNHLKTDKKDLIYEIQNLKAKYQNLSKAYCILMNKQCVDTTNFRNENIIDDGLNSQNDQSKLNEILNLLKVKNCNNDDYKLLHKINELNSIIKNLTEEKENFSIMFKEYKESKEKLINELKNNNKKQKNYKPYEDEIVIVKREFTYGNGKIEEKVNEINEYDKKELKKVYEMVDELNNLILVYEKIMFKYGEIRPKNNSELSCFLIFDFLNKKLSKLKLNFMINLFINKEIKDKKNYTINDNITRKHRKHRYMVNDEDDIIYKSVDK